MSEAPAKRGFPWWAYRVVLVVILAFALWPIGSVMYAASVAEAHGCAVDEGSVHSCIVNGQDIGEQLYAFGVMGWFMLATVPLGGGALIVWLIVLLIHRSAWGRRQRAAP
ncbi:MAG: hypothetical protein ACOH2M_28020 [Cypionkella sp.]